MRQVILDALEDRYNAQIRSKCKSEEKIYPEILLGNVIVTTTDNIDGMKIVSYKGLVHYRANVLNEFSFEKKLARSALELGANAVVGVKTGGTDPIAIMVGTAVVVEKI